MSTSCINRNLTSSPKIANLTKSSTLPPGAILSSVGNEPTVRVDLNKLTNDAAHRPRTIKSSVAGFAKAIDPCIAADASVGHVSLEPYAN